jgi:hypothetical protein
MVLLAASNRNVQYRSARNVDVDHGVLYQEKTGKNKLELHMLEPFLSRIIFSADRELPRHSFNWTILLISPWQSLDYSFYL